MTRVHGRGRGPPPAEGPGAPLGCLLSPRRTLCAPRGWPGWAGGDSPLLGETLPPQHTHGECAHSGEPPKAQRLCGPRRGLAGARGGESWNTRATQRPQGAWRLRGAGPRPLGTEPPPGTAPGATGRTMRCGSGMEPVTRPVPSVLPWAQGRRCPTVRTAGSRGPSVPPALSRGLPGVLASCPSAGGAERGARQLTRRVPARLCPRAPGSVSAARTRSPDGTHGCPWAESCVYGAGDAGPQGPRPARHSTGFSQEGPAAVCWGRCPTPRGHPSFCVRLL